MKQKARQAVRKNIKESFYQWCEQNEINANADALVRYDKENPGLKLLDHEKAKKEGYYLHLRDQACALISSWCTITPLKSNAGASTPFEPTIRQVRLQEAYNIPGRGTIRVSRMEEADLKTLMNLFRIEAENKLARMYLIGKRLERLDETRGQVRKVFQEAEEAAYQSVN